MIQGVRGSNDENIVNFSNDDGSDDDGSELVQESQKRGVYR
jgi:hypothetical protein